MGQDSKASFEEFLAIMDEPPLGASLNNADSATNEEYAAGIGKLKEVAQAYEEGDWETVKRHEAVPGGGGSCEDTEEPKGWEMVCSLQ